MEELKNRQSSLHKLAMRAKERLRRGNYQEEIPVKKANQLRLFCPEGLKPEITITVIEREINSKLYKKVQKLLESDENEFTPFAKLIDNAEYKNMDEIQKERYMLEISDNYIKLRDYFNKQKVNFG